MKTRDQWAEWLAERRHGGDPEQRRRGLKELVRYRDAVLDGARLSEGDTLLDIGCGEGLIGFGALERGAGSIVFSDISRDLLDFCQDAARDLGVLDHCRFVQASADDLAGIDDESVDVVTARSVLIYVADKAAAFHEFFRVLKPQARLALGADQPLRPSPGADVGGLRPRCPTRHLREDSVRLRRHPTARLIPCSPSTSET